MDWAGGCILEALACLSGDNVHVEEVQGYKILVIYKCFQLFFKCTHFLFLHMS